MTIFNYKVRYLEIITTLFWASYVFAIRPNLVGDWKFYSFIIFIPIMITLGIFNYIDMKKNNPEALKLWVFPLMLTLIAIVFLIILRKP